MVKVINVRYEIGEEHQPIRLEQVENELRKVQMDSECGLVFVEYEEERYLCVPIWEDVEKAIGMELMGIVYYEEGMDMDELMDRIIKKIEEDWDNGDFPRPTGGYILEESVYEVLNGMILSAEDEYGGGLQMDLWLQLVKNNSIKEIEFE